jgi:hypothetical protein
VSLIPTFTVENAADWRTLDGIRVRWAKSYDDGSMRAYLDGEVHGFNNWAVNCAGMLTMYGIQLIYDPITTRPAELDKTPIYEPTFTPKNSEKAFYTVYADDNGYKPVAKRFYSAEEAYAAAEKYAELTAGQDFFVLRAVSRINASKVVTTDTIPLA